jgi:hypothetical protein
LSSGVVLKRGDELVEMAEESHSTEDLLQDLVARHPNLLAGDQINREVPRRWLLLTREAPLAASEDGAAIERFLRSAPASKLSPPAPGQCLSPGALRYFEISSSEGDDAERLSGLFEDLDQQEPVLFVANDHAGASRGHPVH